MLTPTIGIEVHVELKSKTKVFSDSINNFKDDINTNVNVIDLGYPGTLPKLNKEVIDEALKAAEKMSKGKFDLEDFLVQLNSIKKLGPLENILKMLPGAKKMGLNNVNIDPKQMAHIEAIILSMTPKERKNPDILKASRKKRIALGCGQSVEDVNRLLKQFEQMKTMMKQFKNGNLKLPF